MKHRVEQILKEALVLSRNHQPEKVLAMLEEARAKNPTRDQLILITILEAKTAIQRRQAREGLMALGTIERDVASLPETSIIPTMYHLTRALGLYHSQQIDQCKDALKQAEFYMEKLKQVKDDSISTEDLLVLEDNLMFLKGYLAYDQGNNAEAQKYFMQCMAMRTRVGQPWERALIHNALGTLHVKTGNNDKAKEHYQAALQIMIELNHKQGIAGLTYNLGYLEYFQGNLVKALNYYNQSLVIRREIEASPLEKAASLTAIGTILASMGKLKQAREHYSKALAIFQNFHSEHDIALCYFLLAQINRQQGNYTEALKQLEKALSIRKRQQDPHYISHCLDEMALNHWLLNELDEARSSFQEAVRLSRSVGNPLDMAEKLFNWFSFSLHVDDHEEALRAFEDLAAIEKEHPTNPQIHHLRLLARAMLLKTENRLTSKIQAMQLLKDALKISNTDQDYVIKTVLELADLLILEYRAAPSKEVIAELTNLVSEAERIAATNQLQPLMVEVLLLKAKINLLTIELERAFEFLQEALLVSEQHGLLLHLHRVENERARVFNELKKWHAALEQSDLELRLILTSTVSELMSTSLIPRKQAARTMRKFQSLNDEEVQSFLSELRNRNPNPRTTP